MNTITIASNLAILAILLLVYGRVNASGKQPTELDGRTLSHTDSGNQPTELDGRTLSHTDSGNQPTELDGRTLSHTDSESSQIGKDAGKIAESERKLNDSQTHTKKAILLLINASVNANEEEQSVQNVAIPSSTDNVSIQIEDDEKLFKNNESESALSGQGTATSTPTVSESKPITIDDIILFPTRGKIQSMQDGTKLLPTENDYCFSKDTENEISSCLNISSYSSLSRPDFEFLEFYNDFIPKIDYSNQQKNMCITQICLDHLISDGFMNFDARENFIHLMKKSPVKTDQSKEFSSLYSNYLEKHTENDLGLLNLVSFCSAQTCIAVLQKYGFDKNSSANDNKVKVKKENGLAANLLSSGKSVFLRYKNHLLYSTNKEENGYDICTYCIFEVCLRELNFAGFYEASNGLQSYNYLLMNLDKITKLNKIYDFINLFTKQLILDIYTDKKDSSMGPYEYCSNVTTLGITIT